MADLGAMGPEEYEAYCRECDARGSAEFRMRREMCGIEIAEIADALGVRIDTAKRWENPNKGMEPSVRAWAYVDERYGKLMRAVEDSVALVEGVEDAIGRAPNVNVAYWRGKGQTAFGEPVKDANRTARITAAVLRSLGYGVRVVWSNGGSDRISVEA